MSHLPELDPKWPEDGWAAVGAVIVMVGLVVLYCIYGGQ